MSTTVSRSTGAIICFTNASPCSGTYETVGFSTTVKPRPASPSYSDREFPNSPLIEASALVRNSNCVFTEETSRNIGTST